MKYFLIGLLIYIGYRFVVNFLIPVARATRQMKTQMNTMREQMQQAQGFAGGFQQQAKAQPTQTPAQKPKYDLGGEYIAFEENPK